MTWKNKALQTLLLWKVIQKIPSFWSEEEKVLFEKEKLIYEIKYGHLSFKYGPVFLRVSIFYLLKWKRIYHALLALHLKFFFLLLFLIFFVSPFVITRGVLPVFERIPPYNVHKEFSPYENIKTIYLFPENKNPPVLPTEFSTSLRNYKIETAHNRYDIFQGVMISSLYPYHYQKNPSIKQNFIHKNTFEFMTYLIPTTKNPQDCHFIIKNEKGETLFSMTKKEEISEITNPTQILLWFRQRLTPSTLKTTSLLSYHRLELEKLFEEIHITVASSTPSSCTFILGNPRLHLRQTTPQKSPRILWLQLDALSSSFLKPEEMPFTSWLLSQKGLFFENAFSSSFPFSLNSTFQKKGYEVAHLGSLPSSFPPFTTVLSHRPYATRNITEEAKKWLESHAHQSFFLTLSYPTLFPPFRPSFAHLDMKSYLSSNPLSSKGEILLYQGLLKDLDDEIKIIWNYLQNSQLKDVLIIISSSYGLHLSPQEGFLENPFSQRGKGLHVFEEIHVPFWIGFSYPARQIHHAVSLKSIYKSIQEYIEKDAQEEYIFPQKEKVILQEPHAITIINQTGNDSFQKLTYLNQKYSFTAYFENFPWRKNTTITQQEIFSLIHQNKETNISSFSLHKEQLKESLFKNIEEEGMLLVLFSYEDSEFIFQKEGEEEVFPILKDQKKEWFITLEDDIKIFSKKSKISYCGENIDTFILSKNKGFCLEKTLEKEPHGIYIYKVPYQWNLKF